MKKDRGFPFEVVIDRKKLRGIITYISDVGIDYYTVDPDSGKFILDSLSVDKRTLRFCPSIIRDMDVHAKIISVEESIHKYGMRQRKEDFLNAVLPIIDIGVDDEGDYVVLQSARDDGAQLKMSVIDVLFIFPILKRKNNDGK